MKKYFTLLFFTVFSIAQAQQAFSGKGDTKINVGANLQDGGSGIQGSVDFGIGENFSYGFVANYLLGVTEFSGFYNDGTTQYYDEKPDFKDRFDAKFRLNANLGTVFNIDE